MVRFTSDDDLRGLVLDEAAAPGARFWLSDLSGSRFEQSYLSGAVMRGVDLTDADIDGWIGGLVINGVEVAPIVEAELNLRFPGRELRRSGDPAELLESYDAAQARWAEAIELANERPELRDAHVDAEWSISQTLRHLVLATDGWLRHSVHGMAAPFSLIGVPFTEYDSHAASIGVDITATPSWEQVLAVRADRVGQVRDFLAHAGPADFDAVPQALPPWYDDEPEEERRKMTVGHCLGVIGNEEWEHLRYALRDLDTLGANGAP
ncbi:MAG: DinB family protein [Promicromonosporaceae bacterium]|nr:DinB family protein [Promicromonosporaceae bacterium]